MTLGKVESAFLKDQTDVYNLTFQTEKSIKVKIEVDTKPPLSFQTEYKRLLHPYTFMARSKELDAWSNEYFVELLGRVKFETD